MDATHGMTLIRKQRGAQARIARALGFTTGAIALWSKVPAEYVVTVEEATGIAREDLRPDLHRQPVSVDTATAA